MPIDWSERIRVAPSIHACRAVVATRLRWPEHEAAMLRRLRVLDFAGELLDDSDTLELAAEQAGAAGRRAGRVGRRARGRGGAAAPTWRPRARPRPPRARRTTSSAGPDEERRYTCPSYELLRAHRPARRLADRAPRRPARLPPGRGLRGGDRQPRARAHPPARSQTAERGARVGGRAAGHRRGRGRDGPRRRRRARASSRASRRSSRSASTATGRADDGAIPHGACARFARSDARPSRSPSPSRSCCSCRRA